MEFRLEANTHESEDFTVLAVGSPAWIEGLLPSVVNRGCTKRVRIYRQSGDECVFDYERDGLPELA